MHGHQISNHLKPGRILATLAMTTLLAAPAHAATEAGQAVSDPAFDPPVSLSLNFGYHVDMDMHEQDVFIEREPGSGEVWRVTKADQDWSLPLYRAAERQEHAPFDPDDQGPFPKGEPLGMTLGEWFAGRGQGTYSCRDGQGHIDIRFEKLAREAVYTMWHWFVAMPPTEPFIGTYDLPMGSRDGADSVFRTDADGNAHFVRDFTPCLQMSGEHLSGGLAVALHSDGRTYGPLAGDFASNAHVQLFLMLPKRHGL